MRLAVSTPYLQLAENMLKDLDANVVRLLNQKVEQFINSEGGSEILVQGTNTNLCHKTVFT